MQKPYPRYWSVRGSRARGDYEERCLLGRSTYSDKEMEGEGAKGNSGKRGASPLREVTSLTMDDLNTVPWN